LVIGSKVKLIIALTISWQYIFLPHNLTPHVCRVYFGGDEKGNGWREGEVFISIKRSKEWSKENSHKMVVE